MEITLETKLVILILHLGKGVLSLEETELFKKKDAVFSGFGNFYSEL